MAEVISKDWDTEFYIEQRDSGEWPRDGQHILAQYDDDSIIVYQAFCPEIADYAVKHQRFGGDRYSFQRMSWVKTNFLWMMHRCNWCTKKNQERVLAVRITREGFDTILSKAFIAHDKAKQGKRVKSPVRLQWDPDYAPGGERVLRRRAIQFGLRSETLLQYGTEWVVEIKDVTDFVHEQHKCVKSKQLDKLFVPRERVYPVTNTDTAAQIRIDTFRPKV